MKSGFMGYVRKINAIQWNNGNYKTIEEECVEDKHAYLFIDNLPPRFHASTVKNADFNNHIHISKSQQSSHGNGRESKVAVS